MENCLILLTNYFPYYKGEEYLESEIVYLSNKFKKVIIYATMADKNMERTRNVPKNVEVLKSRVDHSLIGKVKMTIKGLPKAIKNKRVDNLLKNDGAGSPFKKIFSYYFEARSMYLYRHLEKQIKSIDFNEYKNVTIYSYWLFVTARIAIELKKSFFLKQKCFVFSRAHGYDINEFANKLNFLPERAYLLSNLDYVFPVSQYGVDFLKKKYSRYGKNVEVRRLGTFSNKKEKKHTNEILNIVSCSTVRSLKRIHLIIEALEELENQNIFFKWTHIGNGPQYSEIVRFAKEKLSPNNYQFLGAIPNKEVLKWYEENETTVFINTSSSEGVPVSIMEAMSMGIPIIATDVGGTKEIMLDSEMGYLLSSDCSVEEIVDKLLKIHNMNDEEYKKMCVTSKKLWGKICNANLLYLDFSEEISTKYF